MIKMALLTVCLALGCPTIEPTKAEQNFCSKGSGYPISEDDHLCIHLVLHLIPCNPRE